MELNAILAFAIISAFFIVKEGIKDSKRRKKDLEEIERHNG